MGKGTKDPRKPSKAYAEANSGSASAAASGSAANGKAATPMVATETSSKGKGKNKATTTAPGSTQTAPSPAKGKSKAKDAAPADRTTAFRSLVQELGGDEDDVRMLADVDEDDEVVKKGDKSQKRDTKDLKAELEGFMKGLDFASVVPGVVEDDEEEAEGSGQEGEGSEVEEESEEESEEDSDEDAEEEDEEDEEQVEEEKPKPTPKSAAPTPVAPSVAADSDFKVKSGLQATSDARVDNIPQSPLWYQIPVPELPLSAPLPPVPASKLATLQSRATALLASLSGKSPTSSLGRYSKSSSDTAFLSQILASGTHQDKLSALVLLVRESPLHRTAEMERLRAMAGWSEGGVGRSGGGREEKVAVMRALSDWWVSGGGKEGGKLRYFADQPLLGHPALTERHLVLFAFEDWLKKWYFSLLQLLEAFLHDTLPFVRTQALQITFKLLAGNAEQEQNLLRLGVNKLGDTDKGVASKASHQVLVLMQTHPAMKAVIVREVAALVLKTSSEPAASSSTHGKGKAPAKPASQAEAALNHGRYYGLVTLNQVILTVKDRDVAARLVEVYFEIFRELLDSDRPDVEDGEPENAIEKVAGKVNKWQGRHKGTRQSKGKGKAHEDEEAEQGDSKLISAVLTGINRALPFAKLDDSIFEKHAETLFRITHVGTFNISIRALMLIHQVASAKEAVSDRFYRTLYQSMLDPRLTASSKQAMYLNLLFKAIKSDTSIGRVMAFVKRLLQVMTLHQPPFICGAMYLLGELFSNTAGLRTLLNEPEDTGVETFKDVDDAAKAKDAESTTLHSNAYDGRKRDPQHANAQGSCLWELVPFLNHYHPSVSLQAGQLLELHLPLSGSADISQNTLISFLDRFVYRNPKKHAMAKGASIMQPAAVVRGEGLSVVKNRGPRIGGESGQVEAGFVNDERFWKKKAQDVPADQLFFHKYFNLKIDKQKALESSAAKRKKGKKGDASDEDADLSDEVEEDDDEEDASEGEDDAPASAPVAALAEDGEESDPEEAEIWKAMKNSMPQAFDDDDLLDDSGEDEFDDDESLASGSEVVEGSDADMDDSDAGAFEDEEYSDGDVFSGEDSDDLLSEDEMPNIPLAGGEIAADDDQEEAEPSEDEQTTLKRKRREETKANRKKRKALPLLASAEDYAALIDGAAEEDL